MEAALLVVMDRMNSKQWYTSTKQLQETSLQVCATVRRLPREKLVVVLDNTPPLLPMVAADEAHPEHHGTRVPRIRVRSVKWDVMSTDILTCYMRAFAIYISSCFSINLLLDARCSMLGLEGSSGTCLTHHDP